MENNEKLTLQPLVQEQDKIPEKTEIVISTEAERRPPIEQDTELQREYIDIYLMRVIQGKSLLAIAKEKGIYDQKVRAALKWCRSKSEDYIWIEALTDALAAEDERLNRNITTQDKLRVALDGEEAALAEAEASLAAATELKEIDKFKDLRYDHRVQINNLHRLILSYEDKIQVALDKKFNLQNLYQKHILEIKPENFQLNNITSFTANIKEAHMSAEDRDAIARILERTYRRKI